MSLTLENSLAIYSVLLESAAEHVAIFLADFKKLFFCDLVIIFKSKDMALNFNI